MWYGEGADGGGLKTIWLAWELAYFIAAAAEGDGTGRKALWVRRAVATPRIGTLLVTKRELIVDEEKEMATMDKVSGKGRRDAIVRL